MKRLMEKIVFSGFVMPWRFATCPTRVSPSLVKATTEGVNRLPSWLAMTVGSPPSTTATTEFVVPRSMPITFAMSSISCREVSRQRPSRRGEGPRHGPTQLLHVDLDLFRLHRLDLRKGHRQDAVAIPRTNVIGLHGNGELEHALDTPRPSLRAEELLGLHGLRLASLAFQAQQITGDGHLHVLLAHAGKVHLDHELVLRLVHVRRWRPRSIKRRPLDGTSKERVEETIDL